MTHHDIGQQPAARPGGDLAALSPWARELAQTFVTLSSDIALVLDARGVITDVAQSAGEPLAPTAGAWVGRPWAETVTGDTRRKVESLLQDVADAGLARRCEVNHPSLHGGDIPVAYTAIRLGSAGPVLVVGRDLRAIAAIQQRFLEAQQELEQGYWRGRQAEARRRLLEQVASDALLVLDAGSLQLLSANASARQRLGLGAVLRPGLPLLGFFDAHARPAVEELMATARSSGRPVELRARLAGSAAPSSLSAAPFRSGDAHRLLVRLRATAPVDLPVATAGQAVVVTDSAGRVLSADAASVELFGEPGAAGGLSGRLLGEWLGANADDCAQLLAEVRRDGLAQRDAMTLRVPGAPRLRAAIDAGWLADDEPASIGLLIRPLPAARLVAAPLPALAELPRAWEHVASQLGHDDLPTLLRDATRLAERQFIETALQRSGGDLDAAAALLGISRAALLRRRRRVKGGGGRT